MFLLLLSCAQGLGQGDTISGANFSVSFWPYFLPTHCFRVLLLRSFQCVVGVWRYTLDNGRVTLLDSRVRKGSVGPPRPQKLAGIKFGDFSHKTWSDNFGPILGEISW